MYKHQERERDFTFELSTKKKKVSKIRGRKFRVAKIHYVQCPVLKQKLLNMK